MAGDRLQIVLETKNKVSAELKQVKADMNSLGRTATTLQNRMEAGEQGLQGEYEQTRRALEKNRLHQIELGRAAAKARSEIREMTTDGTAGLKRMDRSADGLNRSMGKTHTASKTMAVGWGKMVGVVAGVTAAVGALSGSFRFLSSSINEARDARKAVAQTAAVLKSMGRTESSDALTKMIENMEALSGIDGDELRVATNTLLTFGNVSGPIFKQANQAALDVSVAFKKDLQSSAVMVGKALNDPLKGLTSLQRIGVSFTTQQTEQVKAMMAVGDIAGAQAIVMAELSRETKGSAAAQADSIAKTQVAWKNLKEAIGEVLLSSGTGGVDILGMLKQTTKWIVDNKDLIVSILQRVMGFLLKSMSMWLKYQSIVLGFFGYFIGAMGTTLTVLARLGLVDQATADTVNGLADTLGEASDTANRHSESLNTMANKANAAATASKELSEALKGVKSNAKIRLVLTTIVKGFQGMTDIGAPVPGAAMGGFVQGPTLVGELGPELFVPTIGSPRVIGADGPEIRDFRTAGTVIPNHLLATVTIPAQKQSAAVAGPQVHIGTINAATDVDVERDVLRAMMRADRIARERQ